MKTYRTPKNKALYKQFDSRWGNLLYPSKPSTLASSGCGCVAVTHCAIERARYSNYTPKDVYPFMKNYAVVGHGTEWKGIDEGLKHYGLKNEKRLATMTELWAEMKKGNVIGVLLMNNNTSPNGTLWTLHGHYVAILGLRISKDGKKHWLYCKDSGGRNHDGWYQYETILKNCVNKIFVAEVPEDDIVLPSRGYFQYGDEGEDVKDIQSFLKKQGLYNGKIGGHYKSRTKRAVKKLQKKYGLKVDGLFGNECLALYEKLK